MRAIPYQSRLSCLLVCWPVGLLAGLLVVLQGLFHSGSDDTARAQKGLEKWRKSGSHFYFEFHFQYYCEL